MTRSGRRSGTAPKSFATTRTPSSCGLEPDSNSKLCGPHRARCQLARYELCSVSGVHFWLSGFLRTGPRSGAKDSGVGGLKLPPRDFRPIILGDLEVALNSGAAIALMTSEAERGFVAVRSFNIESSGLFGRVVPVSGSPKSPQFCRRFFRLWSSGGDGEPL